MKWASCQIRKIAGCACAGKPGKFSPPSCLRDPDMHQGTCVTHMPWCIPGSLTSVFRRSRWRGKRSRHSRRISNPQFYVSGKRPMGIDIGHGLGLVTGERLGFKEQMFPIAFPSWRTYYKLSITCMGTICGILKSWHMCGLLSVVSVVLLG